MRLLLCVLLLLPGAAAGPLVMYAHIDDALGTLAPVEPEGEESLTPCVGPATWRATPRGAAAQMGELAWMGNATLVWHWAAAGPLLQATTIVRLGDRGSPAEVGRVGPLDLTPGSPEHERVGAWDIYRLEITLDTGHGSLFEVELDSTTGCAPTPYSPYTGPVHRSVLLLENASGLRDPHLVMEPRGNSTLVALYGQALWTPDDIQMEVQVEGPAQARAGFANTYCCGYAHDDGHPIAVWDVEHLGPGNVTLHVEARSATTGDVWSGSIQVQQAAVPVGEDSPFPWAAVAFVVVAAAAARHRSTP